MRKNWDFSNITCLVAEGSLHMRGIFRSVLTGFGIRSIFEANDGAEALEIALDRRPDIILCEWHMKPISGGEFVRILRADKDRFLNTTPVIVVSADSKRTTIIEAARIGIHGFVAKPVSPSVLYSRIGVVLQAQEGGGRTKGILKVNGQNPARAASAGKTSKTIDLDAELAAANASQGESLDNELALL